MGWTDLIRAVSIDKPRCEASDPSRGGDRGGMSEREQMARDKSTLRTLGPGVRPAWVRIPLATFWLCDLGKS